MAKSTFKYVTFIRTTPEKLWHALTTTEVVKKYWFGIRLEGSWSVGSKWQFFYDNDLMDSGEILENVPQKRLVRSWRNEWKPEFKAEGTSESTYLLEPFGKSVKLTVLHSIDRADSKFIEALGEGWPMCMSNLKSLLETGEVVLTEHPGH